MSFLLWKSQKRKGIIGYLKVSHHHPKKYIYGKTINMQLLMGWSSHREQMKQHINDYKSLILTLQGEQHLMLALHLVAVLLQVAVVPRQVVRHVVEEERVLVAMVEAREPTRLHGRQITQEGITHSIALSVIK